MVRERLEIDILIKLELLDKLSYPIKNKRLQTTYGLHKSVIIGIINYLLEHINTHFGHTIMLRPCKRMVHGKGAALNNCIAFIPADMQSKL